MRRKSFVPTKHFRKLISKSERVSTVATNILVIISVAEIVLTESHIDRINRAFDIGGIVGDV